jgi:hypothetical protein
MTISRIWDLRRGDDDDNRTSPHGRGLWSIILSTALEFNPLKASIGFLALIIGPALLVGIAPSIVVTYGRLMFHKATLAGSSPIFALVSLAVLVGAALWIGRPLLALAVDHFWHLHYTLVVPILVALRELLRAGAERFPGRPITSEQLNRRRRLGTVLAALLLAAGARSGTDRRSLDRPPTRRCRARPAVGSGKGGARQRGGNPRSIHYRREPVLALARAHDQRPGSRSGAKPVESRIVGRSRGASLGSAPRRQLFSFKMALPGRSRNNNVTKF